MLKSLFGDLSPLRDTLRDTRSPAPEQVSHAPTIPGPPPVTQPDILLPLTPPALSPSTPGSMLVGLENTGALSSSGVTHDPRHLEELLVNGSPAQAMRAHFSSSRKDTFIRQKLITLCDPSSMWAAAVIRALADASGQPIERLNLLDQTSLNPLATIERTTLPRRTGDTLKIYHADIQAEGLDATEVQMALMERSDLSVVIVGPMSHTAIQEMLRDLHNASLSLHWQCRHLLFMLPVGAEWMAQQIEHMDWPDQVRVVTLNEPLSSASAVWNRMLMHWQKLRNEQPSGPNASMVGSAPMPLAEPLPRTTSTRPVPFGPAPTQQSTVLIGQRQGGAGGTGGISGTNSAAPDSLPPDFGHSQFNHSQLHSLPPSAPLPARAEIDLRRAQAVLDELTVLDGLIFVALVNGQTGQLQASPARGPDIERAAQASAEIWRTHKNSLRLLGHTRPQDPLEEILVTAGSRYHILRTLRAHPDYFILAVLDKLRSNLAMTRYRVMEAQQVLL